MHTPSNRKSVILVYLVSSYNNLVLERFATQMPSSTSSWKTMTSMTTRKVTLARGHSAKRSALPMLQEFSLPRESQCKGSSRSRLLR